MIQLKSALKFISFLLLGFLLLALLGFLILFAAKKYSRQPAPALTAISAGFYHGCSLASGAVKCWGSNGFGQIEAGGDTGDRLFPTNVIAAGASAISAGEYHSCAIVSGALQCWGSNENGQLGNGSTAASGLPVSVIAADVTAIAAGGRHTCAIVSGALQCWGDNSSGQIGDGSTEERNSPVTIIASGVTAVAAGRDSSCAIVAGALKCWGAGVGGKMIPSPETIIASGVTAVATGVQHSCAIVKSSLQCWGWNIGDGDTVSRPVPVTVIASGVSAISTKFGHSCAIVSQALQCWGDNHYGQLGDAPVTESLVPITSITSGVTAVAVGVDFSCAIIFDTVNCWGRNASGQLGDGSIAGDGYSETIVGPRAIIDANGNNLWVPSVAPAAPLVDAEKWPAPSLNCSTVFSESITLPETMAKDQLIALLHPEPFKKTAAEVEIVCGVGAKEWKLGKSYIALLVTQIFTKNSNGGVDIGNTHIALATIENPEATQSLKILAKLANGLELSNLDALDFIDTAAYQVNTGQYAFGLRSNEMFAYSGGGGANNYLQLFRVQGDSLVPILKTIMASSSLIAGEWNDDGTREHDEYSSGPALIHVLATESHGVYDLKKTIAEKNRPNSMVFKWDGESYTSSDPEIIENHNDN